MVEFFSKFENRGIKMARVNTILISKYINFQLFTLILYGFGVCCDRMRFSVLSAFTEKSIHKYMNDNIVKRDANAMYSTYCTYI